MIAIRRITSSESTRLGAPRTHANPHIRSRDGSRFKVLRAADVRDRVRMDDATNYQALMDS